MPDMAIPDVEKGEDYHKRAILAILGGSVLTGYAPNLYEAMNRSMNFYNGDHQIQNKFDFLQKDYNGKSLPAVWINYNKIRNKINLLEGEYAVQKVEVACKTINRDAASRKMKKKAQILTNKLMSQIMPEIDPTGELLPQGNTGYVPHTEEELEVYMQSSYKEPIERTMDSILKYDVERMKYVRTRLALARYMLITGRAISKIEFRGSRPNIRAVDPRFVIVDPYCYDDNLSTAAYIGEWRYAPLAEVASDYGLSLEDMERVRKDGLWLWAGYVTGGNTSFMQPFSIVNGQVMTLVFHAEWRDVKQVRAKVVKDQYGGEHVKILNDKDSGELSKKEIEQGGYVEERNIETIRKATLIGGYFLKDWGEQTNIIRNNVDTLTEAEYTYTIVCPQYVNFRSVSKVEELEALQEFKDLIMYTVQQEMSTAGKKGFIYDTKYKPDNLSLEDVMYYLKVAGIAFTDSGREGLPPQGNPFPTIDTSLGTSINLYLNLAQYIDMEMDKVSGINDARQGFQKSDALVGVSQMAMVQSSLITQPLNKAFEIFENLMMQKYANYVKTIFPFIKEQYEPIISEIGLDIMDVDGDIPLQSYGIFVQVNGTDIMNDRSKFEQALMLALQGGHVNMDDFMMLSYEPDTKTAVKKYLAIQERKMAMQQEQMAMQMEAQAAMKEAEQVASTQSQIEVDAARTENKMMQQEQREGLKQETMGVKAQIDMMQKENEQNFQAIMEALKGQQG